MRILYKYHRRTHTYTSNGTRGGYTMLLACCSGSLYATCAGGMRTAARCFPVLLTLRFQRLDFANLLAGVRVLCRYHRRTHTYTSHGTRCGYIMLLAFRSCSLYATCAGGMRTAARCFPVLLTLRFQRLDFANLLAGVRVLCRYHRRTHTYTSHGTRGGYTMFLAFWCGSLYATGAGGMRTAAR